MFMLGIAIGQLIHGPLSDRFGRKAAILGGLILTTVATAGCAMAVSIEALAVLRSVHGIAASSGWLIARAAIRDRHQRDDAARMMSLMLIFHSAGPLLSPIIRRGPHGAVWLAGVVRLSVRSIPWRWQCFSPLRSARPSRRSCPMRSGRGPCCGNFAEIARSRVFWAVYRLRDGVLRHSVRLSELLFGRDHHLFRRIRDRLRIYVFRCHGSGLVSGMLASARLVSRFGGDNLLRWGMLVATVFGLLLMVLAVPRGRSLAGCNRADVLLYGVFRFYFSAGDCRRSATVSPYRRRRVIAGWIRATDHRSADRRCFGGIVRWVAAGPGRGSAVLGRLRASIYWYAIRKYRAG